MPFLTEEVWQKLPKPTGTPQSIMITLYPMADPSLVDDEAERTLGLVQAVVTAVRATRAEYRLPPAAPLEVTAMSADPGTRARLEEHAALVERNARLARLAVAPRGEPPAGSVVSVVGGEVGQAGLDLDVAVVVAGQIDVAAERARIAKDLQKAEKERAQSAGKLSNRGFVDRAPPDVVAEERRRLADAEERIGKLRASAARLERL